MKTLLSTSRTQQPAASSIAMGRSRGYVRGLDSRAPDEPACLPTADPRTEPGRTREK